MWQTETTWHRINSRPFRIQTNRIYTRFFILWSISVLRHYARSVPLAPKHRMVGYDRTAAIKSVCSITSYNHKNTNVHQIDGTKWKTTQKASFVTRLSSFSTFISICFREGHRTCPQAFHKLILLPQTCCVRCKIIEKVTWAPLLCPGSYMSFAVTRDARMRHTPYSKMESQSDWTFFHESVSVRVSNGLRVAGGRRVFPLFFVSFHRRCVALFSLRPQSYLIKSKWKTKRMPCVYRYTRRQMIYFFNFNTFFSSLHRRRQKEMEFPLDVTYTKPFRSNIVIRYSN